MTAIVTNKVITPKKKSAWRKPLSVLLILLAVPVIVIAGISLLIFYLIFWVGRKMFTPRLVINDKYYLRLELIQQPGIGIWMVEDEDDLELMRLNELWADEVYAQETSIFRLQTAPLLPVLEGRFCCHYLKEISGGSILQILAQKGNGNQLDTQLIFLDHQLQTITLIDETGPYHLYNDDNDKSCIKGFNNESYLEITITY